MNILRNSLDSTEKNLFCSWIFVPYGNGLKLTKPLFNKSGFLLNLPNEKINITLTIANPV